MYTSISNTMYHLVQTVQCCNLLHSLRIFIGGIIINKCTDRVRGVLGKHVSSQYNLLSNQLTM